MASVSLSSVSMRFGNGAMGLADIDLAIQDGEFLALVGPSGSGKTTLLRTIAGFLAPTSGAVSIGDAVVAGEGVFVQPEHRGLGMVFQQHAVWPHWNVAKNVEYPLKRAGIGRAERTARVAEALELVGMPGAQKRDPATLSGGQRQRVALARALVARPKVLLLDEALSALDEPLRDHLRLELKTLSRELGLTVVHVTHDRSEALALADRIAVLESGRIQQVASPEEILREPVSAFVAQFMSDATLVSGSMISGSFHADDLPFGVSEDAVTGCESGQEVVAAVLPSDVFVTSDAAGDGVIRSALFTREGSDLMIDWAGTSMRARSSQRGFQVGDRVSVRVIRARTYQRDGLSFAQKVGV